MSEKFYYGIYQGIVTSHKDPENRGRIKVLCPNVLGGKVESAWCDPMIPVAYDNGGDFCIPAKDEAVWLMFIGGDPNKPVWLGGWWQKNMTPLGKNYSDIDKMRIINYADCTITMRDGKININVGSGAYDLLIENGKVSVQGDLIVSGNINADGNITAKGDVLANNVTATTLVKGKNVTATSTVRGYNVTATNKLSGATVEATDSVSVGSTSINSNTIETSILNATTVNASGKLSADGGITTSEVTADDIKVGGVSYLAHTHGGVTSGSDNTKKPN